MGTNGVTAFYFTFKTSNEDTECFQLLSLFNWKPSVSAMVKVPLKLHIFLQLQNAWLHETLIWCYT